MGHDEKGDPAQPYHFSRLGTGPKSPLIFNLPAFELALMVRTQA